MKIDGSLFSALFSPIILWDHLIPCWQTVMVWWQLECFWTLELVFEIKFKINELNKYFVESEINGLPIPWITRKLNV